MTSRPQPRRVPRRTKVRQVRPESLLLLGLIPAWAACAKEISHPDDPALPWATERVTAPNVEYVVFFSPKAGSDVSFHVFLPDAYADQPTRRFPVVYWLHGSGGGSGGIVPVSTHFRSAMEQGKLPEAIVVFPNGLPHGMWCDSKDGKQPVESMLIHDLVPFVDTSYRTVTTRAGRIVEGFSMGGYGAGRLGFKYPNVFGGFSMLGAGPLQLDFSQVSPGNQSIQPVIFRDVYGGDMAYFEYQSPWRMAERYGGALPDPTPKRVVVGKLEYVYPVNVAFSDHLTALGIPHQFRAFDGVDHNVMAYFNAMGDSNWVFYNAVFRGATGG